MTREEAIKEIKSWDFLEGKEIEAIQTLIPELKESEDERIRKELIKYHKQQFENNRDQEIGLFHKDAIAWLEKQKEVGIQWLKSDNVKNPDKPYIDKAGMFYTTDGRMCYASDIEKQKEQKQVDYEVELKKCKDNPLYFYDKYVSIKQKPVDPSDDELERHQKELYDFKVFAAKQAKEHHISFVHDFEWNNFCAELLSYFNEKQNFTEWNEEDEDTINLMIAILRENYSNCLFKTNSANTTRMSAISTDMLIKRIEALHPQPKAEWSEEDEDMRDKIISDLEWERRNTTVDKDIRHYDEELHWLKSLRPQPKPEWNESDKVNINLIISYLDSYIKEHNDTFGADECKSLKYWLKSIRPNQSKSEWSEEDEKYLNRVINLWVNDFGEDSDTVKWLKSLHPSWKPSEEQLNRLFSIVAALRKDYCDDMADFLANLYADLKKLGVKEEPEYYQHFDPDC